MSGNNSNHTTVNDYDEPDSRSNTAASSPNFADPNSASNKSGNSVPYYPLNHESYVDNRSLHRGEDYDNDYDDEDIDVEDRELDDEDNEDDEEDDDNDKEDSDLDLDERSNNSGDNRRLTPDLKEELGIQDDFQISIPSSIGGRPPTLSNSIFDPSVIDSALFKNFNPKPDIEARSLQFNDISRKSGELTPVITVENSSSKIERKLLVEDGASAVTKNSNTTIDSAESLKKQSLLQRFSFGLKSSQSKQPSHQPSNMHHAIGFKMQQKRIPASSIKGSSVILENEDREDEAMGNTRYRRIRKATNSGYLPVKAKNKIVELSRLRRVQVITSATTSLNAGSTVVPPAKKNEPRQLAENSENRHIPITGSILAMKFSANGKFLATGGADNILRVWIISSKSESPASVLPPTPQKPILPVNLLDKDYSKHPQEPLNHPRGVTGSSKLSSVSINTTLPTNFHQNNPENSPTPTENSTVVNSVPAQTSLNHSQILSPNAHRTFSGHTAPILDISWSKIDFLLTASADKTVRLWHIISLVCLKVFVHDSPVTSVRFHPTDEQAFISGGGSQTNARLRMWNIAEKKVKYWVILSKIAVSASQQHTDITPAAASVSIMSGGVFIPFITALEFSHDGVLVITGTADGSLYFHESNELRYNTRVDLIPLANAKSFRVTGIETLATGFGQKIGGGGTTTSNERYSNTSGTVHNLDAGYILVTATDSRVRLFNLRDKSLVRRYRGPDIRTVGWMRAVGTEDGRYAICGSEDARVYLWDLDPNSLMPGHISNSTKANGANVDINNENSAVIDQNLTPAVGGKNAFSGSDYTITCAIFAPTKIRNILSLDHPKFSHSSSHLSGVFIFVADVLGNIHIFENEIPPVQPTSKDSLVSQTNKSAGNSPSLLISRSFGEKRNFSATPIRTNIPVHTSITGNLLTVSPSHSEEVEEYSPISPTLHVLQEVQEQRSGQYITPNDFGIQSRDIYFLPKPSTKKEAPPKQIPEIFLGANNLDIPNDLPARRRSNSMDHIRTQQTFASQEILRKVVRSGTFNETTSSTDSNLTFGTATLLSSSANIKAALFENFNKIRPHLKTVSGSNNRQLSTSAIDSAVATAVLGPLSSTFPISLIPIPPVHQPHASIIGGLLTRIRGNTTDSHTRSISAGTSIQQSNPTFLPLQLPTSTPSPPPSRTPGSETTSSIRPLNRSQTVGKSTQEVLRRGGLTQKAGNIVQPVAQSLANLLSTSNGGTPPKLSSFLSSNGQRALPQHVNFTAFDSSSLIDSMGFDENNSRNAFEGDDNEEESVVACHCGSKNFRLTANKKLICVTSKMADHAKQPIEITLPTVPSAMATSINTSLQQNNGTRFNSASSMPKRISISEMDTTKFAVFGSLMIVSMETALFPLNTIQTIAMSQRTRQKQPPLYKTIHRVVSTEGVVRLWRGILPQTIGALPGQACYYLAYESVHDGACADLAGGLFYVPADIVAQRLQTQNSTKYSFTQNKRLYNGAMDVCRKIVQNEGYFGFWRGYVGYVSAFAPASAVQWGVYELAKMVLFPIMVKLEFEKPESISIPMSGAIAGFSALCANNPLEVMRVRMQLLESRCKNDSEAIKRGYWKLGLQIFRTEGPRAFYRGLSARLLTTLPGIVLALTGYEYIKDVASK
ncbi:hypothetical protein HK100_009639 [Physocladia obscura]|uniref:Uncharacterized protein n=1 Tax=Physocladia obscura TaxID=109957 RepID=A0AAD5T9Z0_9FUNG|nr:hypothetical protein HK100_009639 [Physocladia obscura]